MGAHIALRPGPPMGFLGWILPQRTRPMGADNEFFSTSLYELNCIINKKKTTYLNIISIVIIEKDLSSFLIIYI
jgi:hypothetical protein